MKIWLRGLLLLALSVVLLLAGLRYYGGERPTLDSTQSKSNHADHRLEPLRPGARQEPTGGTMTITDEIHTPKPKSEESEVQLQRQFRNAQTANQAQQAVALAYHEGLAVALDWEQKLDGCTETRIDRADAAGRPALARLQQWQDRFCTGFVPSESQLARLQQQPLTLEEARQQAELTQRKRSERSTVQALSAADSPVGAAKVLMEMLAKAGSQEELDGILFMFQVGGSEGSYNSVVQHLLGHYRPASTLQKPTDTLIVEAAVAIYGCWLFGGCHANSRPALSACLLADCQQPLSVEDIWRIHYLSPADFDIATALMQELIQTRGRRG